MPSLVRAYSEYTSNNIASSHPHGLIPATETILRVMSQPRGMINWGLLFRIISASLLFLNLATSKEDIAARHVAIYWDGHSITEVYDNIIRTKEMLKLRACDVQLLNDERILPLLQEDWPQLALIFGNITLPSAKSDIARYF